MPLPQLCDALFSKGNPYSSKAEFIRQLFKAAGARGYLADSYGRKLFNGQKPLSEPLRNEFPETLDRKSLHAFFERILKAHGIRADGDELQRLAQAAGIRSGLTVTYDLFVEALADWFADIVRDGDAQDSVEPHYLRLLEPQERDEESLARQPLYEGDRVDVVHPPTVQSHTVGFYETFEHEWVLKNIGNVRWAGRSLQCLNPRDYLRPTVDTVTIPDRSPDPSGFVTFRLTFQARGHEGKQTSKWRMVTSDGDDCFPGSATQFNVVATVTSSNLTTAGIPHD